jgi:hypothetical protein
MHKIFSGTDEASAIVSQSETDNAQWAYGFRAYVPDTYRAIRDYDETGNRRDYLVARMTEDEALEWVEDNRTLLDAMFQSKRNADYWRSEYDAMSKAYSTEWEAREAQTVATNAVVKFVADEGRKYAIQNELCENYERFLMLAVNREANKIGNEQVISYYGSKVHDEDNAIGSRYRELLRMFVQNATRTRGMTVTVGTRHNAYGVSADNLTLGEAVTNYYGENETSTTVVCESTLTYEQACKANRYGMRNGWQRGHYGLAADAIVEDEDEQY